MVHRTAAEALADEIAVLGNDYGVAFHHSCQELWRVSSAWDRYEALYATQERVELLNQSGGNFWGILQNVMFEHVLLGLCRLTDPPKNRHQINLSVRYLLTLEPSSKKKRLEQAVNRAEAKTKFARSWRDKYIAHNDLGHATGQAGKLAFATRNKVSNSIVAIHDVLRWINMRHFNSEMFLIDMGDNDALEVMGVIADGLRFDGLRRSEYAAGRYSETYERKTDWIGNAPDPTKRYKQQRYALPKALNRRNREVAGRVSLPSSS
jgi:hypothetical protein